MIDALKGAIEKTIDTMRGHWHGWLRKTGKGRKQEKGAQKERREMVSKQPSSTAEIR